jgi:hypothetical protein
MQGAEREAEVEKQLRSGAEVYGIPRDELIKLQTPARYLGNEFGAIHKNWDSASVRFSLTYPEVYEVGASNLGHIVLYTVLNEVRCPGKGGCEVVGCEGWEAFDRACIAWEPARVKPSGEACVGIMLDTSEGEELGAMCASPPRPSPLSSPRRPCDAAASKKCT